MVSQSYCYSVTISIGLLASSGFSMSFTSNLFLGEGTFWRRSWRPEPHQPRWREAELPSLVPRTGTGRIQERSWPGAALPRAKIHLSHPVWPAQGRLSTGRLQLHAASHLLLSLQQRALTSLPEIPFQPSRVHLTKTYLNINPRIPSWRKEGGPALSGGSGLRPLLQVQSAQGRER